MFMFYLIVTWVYCQLTQIPTGGGDRDLYYPQCNLSMKTLGGALGR